MSQEIQLLKDLISGGHTPDYILGYLTGCKECQPNNGIDYQYCIDKFIQAKIGQ